MLDARGPVWTGCIDEANDTKRHPGLTPVTHSTVPSSPLLHLRSRLATAALGTGANNQPVKDMWGYCLVNICCGILVLHPRLLGLGASFPLRGPSILTWLLSLVFPALPSNPSDFSSARNRCTNFYF